MNVLRIIIPCFVMNCALSSIAFSGHYVEKTIFPAVEGGIDFLPLGADHQFSKSGSFTILKEQSANINIFIPFNTRCELSFNADTMPEVEIKPEDKNDTAIGCTSDRERHMVAFTTGNVHNSYTIKLTATSNDISISRLRIKMYMQDTNANGICDLVESFMRGNSKGKMIIIPKPDRPHTAFFYADYFNPSMAAPTDAVQLYYSSKSMDQYIYSTWRDKGYAPQAMLHSRYGNEAEGKTLDVQTNRDGKLFGVRFAYAKNQLVDAYVGPLDPSYDAMAKEKYGDDIHIDYDYYRVPTEKRTALAEEYILPPLMEGVTAFGYDEPDFWSEAGYSQAFKDEWQRYYGEPWHEPHSSVDNRYMAEKLKAFMEKRHIGTIIHRIKQLNPSITTMLAMHSQINSHMSKFTAAYHDLVGIPELDDVIAEVWMGTSQVPIPFEGKYEPRIFDLAYLEYSSFYHLLRDTDKRLWFMMDPKEDIPGRPESEYYSGFIPNLIAATMFPDIDRYIPLIWPNRIYGLVSKEYETIINSVTGALCDFWRYDDGKLLSGSRGIGTFTSDTMGLHLVDPYPMNLDGLFGMALPLMTKGIPVEILSLDRAADPEYLDRFKVLTLTYEYIKPENPDINRALARWCKNGGSLIFFNKKDPYCDIKESWWKKAGYSSPAEHLFDEMGMDIRRAYTVSSPNGDVTLTPIDMDSKISYSLPPFFALTPCPVYDTNIDVLFVDNHQRPLIWMKQYGKGHIIYAGLSSAFLSSSSDGSHVIMSLVRKSMELAGQKYTERPYLAMKRGPYNAIRTLNKQYRLEGMYVDLLSPKLLTVEDPIISENSYAFLKRFEIDASKSPHVMAASGRVRAIYESESVTSVFIQAPSATEGAIRLWKGDKQLKSISMCTDRGEKIPAKHEMDQGTILINFINNSDGVAMRAEWE